MFVKAITPNEKEVMRRWAGLVYFGIAFTYAISIIYSVLGLGKKERENQRKKKKSNALYFPVKEKEQVQASAVRVRV